LKAIFVFCITDVEHQLPALPNDWRFTIRTVAIDHKVLSINKDQYKFGKELGSGAFGSVYSARHATTSEPRDLLLNC
jgi:hypothetical protein